MKERIEVMISEDAIAKRLEELADEIYRDFGGEQVELVCALKGAVVTLVELAKCMKMPVSMNFMSVSSYGNATESSGKIDVKMDLDEDIAGKNVLIVEDIIDSGRTLSRLRELLLSRNPKTLKICTLLDKPERRVTQVPVDYVGFTIPDAFVVGYGLDYAQRYRNLNYVGVLHFDEDETD
ncbi:MAG: hypoxanthine phosphoribosyltransferase [Anaerotignum sp.]|nr:hypoxanthine phosphoribosyltransferase [Anaerotignum sp.]